MLVEPRDRLQERLLFGELGGLLGQIASHCEAVLDVGEEVDLVGDGHLLEDFFGFVALGGGEDLVGFCFWH